MSEWEWELWLSITVYPEGGKRWMFGRHRPTQPSDVCTRLSRNEAEIMRNSLNEFLAQD